jgi:hypothetical protein
MGWTQRQVRPAEPPTSRSEALASCTSHRGIGSIAASPLTTLGGRPLNFGPASTASRAPSDYNINHITLQRSSDSVVPLVCWLSIGAH